MPYFFTKKKICKGAGDFFLLFFTDNVNIGSVLLEWFW